VSGEDVAIIEGGRELLSRRLASTQTTGLATLPKFSDREGGLGIRNFTALLSNLRVIEPDVNATGLPARAFDAPLAADASNLADALVRLQLADPDAFDLLKHDLGRCLPGLHDIRLIPVGGSARSVSVQLVENGLNRPVELADASCGTVRLLALLTALHEPDPPLFTAIEEVDHGLHPYALDILVDRMRAASRRTQILAATHSPTLVNRLNPDEIIVCDRDPKTGESVIPATTPEQIRASIEQSDFGPGELWFSGALNGVPA
jgi:predicted ATPase